MASDLRKKTDIFLRGALKRRGKLPREVQLEITNRCNFACAMCPRHALSAPNKDMEPEILDRAIESLAGIDSVVLTGWGEPLFHEDLPSVLARIRAAHPDITINITTNGALLKGEIAEAMYAHGVDRISVSLDRVQALGGDKGHQRPDKVALTLRRFARKRNGGGPAIVLQPTLRIGCLYDMLDLVEYADEIGAEAINLVRLDTRLARGLKRPTLKEERELVQAVKAQAVSKIPVRYVNHYNLPMRVASHGETVCFRTVYHAYVTVDGDVTPCCQLRNTSLGNLREASLRDVWRSDAYEKFFRNQKAHCGNCDALADRHRSPDGDEGAP